MPGGADAMAQTTIRKGPDPIRKSKATSVSFEHLSKCSRKKWAMAVSGVVLLGFVVTHMIGNLHLYEGPLEIHEYAETLRNLGTDIVPRTWLLWGVRLLLIAPLLFMSIRPTH